MSYGIDKKLGGDSKENVAWMEKCVAKVEATGKPKSSAIAICKSQLSKNKTSDSSVETDVINLENIVRNQYIRKSMLTGRTYHQAKAEYESRLAKVDFDLNYLFD